MFAMFAVFATVVVMAATMVVVPPALAQDSTTTSAVTTGTSSNRTAPVTVSVPTATSLPSGNRVTPSPDIIPRPGTGQEPRDPGDRGGWWQETLFFLMCGAVLVIVGLIWRDSRRARRRQGRLAPRSGTPPTGSEPPKSRQPRAPLEPTAPALPAQTTGLAEPGAGTGNGVGRAAGS
jgi:hypothetical protein